MNYNKFNRVTRQLVTLIQKTRDKEAKKTLEDTLQLLDTLYDEITELQEEKEAFDEMDLIDLHREYERSV